MVACHRISFDSGSHPPDYNVMQLVTKTTIADRSDIIYNTFSSMETQDLAPTIRHVSVSSKLLLHHLRPFSICSADSYIPTTIPSDAWAFSAPGSACPNSLRELVFVCILHCSVCQAGSWILWTTVASRASQTTKHKRTSTVWQEC